MTREKKLNFFLEKLPRSPFLPAKVLLTASRLEQEKKEKMDTTQLTSNEIETLKLFINDSVGYLDGDPRAATYGWAVSDAISRWLGLSEQAAGGVMASLVQKGLLRCWKDEDGTVAKLTTDGYEAAKGLAA